MDVGREGVGVVVGGVAVGVGVVTDGEGGAWVDDEGVGVVTEFPQPVAKTIRIKRSAPPLTRVLLFIPNLSIPYYTRYPHCAKSSN